MWNLPFLTVLSRAALIAATGLLGVPSPLWAQAQCEVGLSDALGDPLGSTTELFHVRPGDEFYMPISVSPGCANLSANLRVPYYLSRYVPNDDTTYPEVFFQPQPRRMTGGGAAMSGMNSRRGLWEFTSQDIIAGRLEIPISTIPNALEGWQFRFTIVYAVKRPGSGDIYGRSNEVYTIGAGVSDTVTIRTNGSLIGDGGVAQTQVGVQPTIQVGMGSAFGTDGPVARSHLIAIAANAADDRLLRLGAVTPAMAEEGTAVAFTVFINPLNDRMVYSDGGVGASWRIVGNGGSPGSSASAADFHPATGTLIIPAGERVATATVMVLDDGVDEASENYRIELTDPRHATLDTPIRQDGIISGLAFAPLVGAREVNEGDVAIYTAALTGGPEHTSTVTAFWSVSVSGIGANGASPLDFEADDGMYPDGVLAFPPGTVSTTFAVPTRMDTFTESNEAYRVSVSVANVAGIADVSHTGIILGNPGLEPDVDVEFAGPDRRVDGDEGDTLLFPLRFNRIRLPTTNAVARVFYTVTGPEITAADFAAAGTNTFSLSRSDPEVSTQNLSIVIADDAVAERTEDFVLTLTDLTLTGGVGGLTSGGQNQRAGRINDNDYLEVSVVAAEDSVTESIDDEVVFMLALDGGLNTFSATTVTYTLGGGAERGVDYTGAGIAAGDAGATQYTATIEQNSTMAAVVFNLTNDAIPSESDETILLTVIGVGNVAGLSSRPKPGGAQAMVTVSDSRPPVVDVGPDRDHVAEGAVTLTAVVTRAAGDSDSTLTYEWRQTLSDGVTVIRGGAGWLGPIGGATGTVTAANGVVSATFHAPDVIESTDYYFRLNATATVAGAAIGGAGDTLRITVEDVEPPTVNVGDDIVVSENTPVTLTAVVTDPDNDRNLRSRWSQIESEPTVTFTDAANPDTRASWGGVAPGVTVSVTLMLTVTDSQGLVGTDTLSVSVYGYTPLPSECAVGMPDALGDPLGSTEPLFQVRAGDEFYMPVSASAGCANLGANLRVPYYLSRWQPANTTYSNIFLHPQPQRETGGAAAMAGMNSRRGIWEFTPQDISAGQLEIPIAVASSAPDGQTFRFNVVHAVMRPAEGAFGVGNTAYTIAAGVSDTVIIDTNGGLSGADGVIPTQRRVQPGADSDFGGGGPVARSRLVAITTAAPDRPLHLGAVVPALTAEGTSVTFTVFIASSNPSDGGTGVSWRIVGNGNNPGGSASAADFVASTGTVRIRAGETEATVTAAIADDGVIEAREHYRVELTDPRHGTLGTPNWQQAAIMGSSLSAPVIRQVNTNPSGDTVPDKTDGAPTTLTLAFNVLDPPAGVSHTAVAQQVDGLSSTADVIDEGDPRYLEMLAPQRFDDGEQYVYLARVVLKDVPATTAYYFRFIVTAVANGLTSDPASVAFAIVVHNTDPPTLTLAGGGAVTEGATATFVLMLDGDPLTATATVPFRVTGDADDYDIAEPSGLSPDATTGIVMIARGTTTGRIVLEISDDRETEGEETLTVELEASQASASFRLGSASSASVTIAPSDRAPTIGEAGYALLGSVMPPATVPDKTGGVTSTLLLTARVASPSAGVTHTAVWRQVSGVGGVVINSNHPDYAGAEISSEALGGFYSSGVSLKSVLTTTTYVFRFTVTATAIVGEFAGGDFTEMSSREVSVVVYDTDAPVAQAGEVPAPTVEGTTATLAGSGMDADGDTGLSYRWTQNPPSPEIVFASTTDPATVVTWPDVTTGSVMEFTLILTVTDSQGLFAMDTLSVTVRDDTPPVADAGDALSVNEGETVLLDGTGSRDSRGGASTSQLSYLWQQVTSNTATAEAVANGLTLTTPQAAVTTWIAPSVGGDYHFRLTVTDSATLLASADVVTVTVARFPDRILSVSGPLSASEGEVVTYTVVLSGGIPHTQPITATWAFQMGEQSGDDDAEAADFGTGGDAEFPTDKVSFAVGTTRSEFSVLIYDDVVAESQEHYDVVISNLEDPSDRTRLSGSTDTLTLSGVEIAASDYLEVSVSAENDVVAEGADSGVTFNLSLEGGTNSVGPTTVTYVLGGSAMRGVDYTAAGISAADPLETIYSTMIGRNGTAASVVLTLTDDSTARESSETIVLTVVGVANDAGLMSRPRALHSSATVTVADDEPSAAELVRLYMPVAAAGDDRQYLETSSTVLDGSGSLPGASSDYSVLRYAWEQVNADDTGADVITAGGGNYLGIITTRSGMPAVGMVTRTDVVQATIYYFRLTVSVTTAGETYSSSDVVSVTINDVEPPLADAGRDFAVTENVSVVLSGHVSDPDNDAGLSLEWTQLESTPAVTFSAAASTNSEVSWTGVPAGSTALVTLLLTARDSQGLIATDTLSVTVRDDTPPVADAGENMGTEKDVVVTLDGTRSRDSRGGTSQLSYLWEQVASSDAMAAVVINGGVALKTPNAVSTELAGLRTEGDYYFRLTVTDRITRQASAAVVTVTVTGFPDRVLSVSGPLSASEGEVVAYTVVLREGIPHTQPITATWAFRMTEQSGDDDAEAADFGTGGDVEFPSGKVGFAVGTTRSEFSVLIYDDAVVEGREHYDVVISNLEDPSDGTIFSGATEMLTLSGAGIAASDDLEVSVSAENTVVAEGATTTFVLMLDGDPLTATATVPFRVTGDADDYDITEPSGLSPDATTGIVMIARGTTTGRIVLEISDDRETEDKETLTVELEASQASASFRLGSASSASVAIDPSDHAAVIAQLGYSLPGVTPPPATVPDKTGGAASTSTRLLLTALVAIPSEGVSHTAVWQQVGGAGGRVVNRDHLDYAGPEISSEVLGVFYSSQVRLKSVLTTTTYVFRVTFTATGSDFIEMSSSEVAVVVYDTDAPVAQAGEVPASVVEGTTATLAGSGMDADGDTGLRYRWTQNPPSPEIVFASATAPETVVTWPDVTTGSEVEFTLTLTVTDSQGLFAADTLSVTVRDDTPPVADAGDALIVNEGETVLLDGTGSRDSRGGASTSQLSYLWQQVTSNTATAEAVINGLTLTTPQAARTTWIAPSTGGDYHFRLTVTDSATLLASAEVVTVTVGRLPDRILSVGGPSSVGEGEVVTYTVVLSGGISHTQPITATWAFRMSEQSGDDDAEAADFGTGGDVEFPSGKVGFAAGATRSEFSVLIYDDVIVEGQEHYDVVISNLEDPSDRTVFSGSTDTLILSGVGIAASDYLEVSVSAENDVVAEGATATFVLMLEGGTNNVGPTTVTYVLGGSAMRGVDYTAAGISEADLLETIYSTMIGRNGTAASVVLTLTDDSTARESSETIILTVSGVANDAGLMSRPRALYSSATVTVADDEPSAAELVRLYMPVADAGDDRQYLETSSTVLDGSGSRPGASGDYGILRYEWEQVNGAGTEADVITSGENHLGIITTRSEMPAVVVTLTDVVQATIYYFRLTVSVTTAGETYSSSDVVSVTINDVEPPLADAGRDFAVTENVSVVLSGRVSDPDNDAGLSLEWTQLESTPAVTFSAAASTNSEASWTGVPAGSTAMVTLLLTVTDSQGLIATDTLSVTVRDDTPPVADAGDALSVNEGETVLLDGTGSRDSRGGASTSQLSYLWQQVTSNTATAEAVINGLTLTTPQAAVTTWIAPSAGGDYHFRLTVTDSATLLASAEVVTVTVARFPDRILSVSGPLSASEGEIVTYTVVLSGGIPHTQPITATWAFQMSEQPGDDDAEAADFGTGGDVEFPEGKIAFAVGTTRSEFSVLIYDDAVAERQEHYDVVISDLEDSSGRTRLSGSTDTLILSGVEIAASDYLEVSVSAENDVVAEGATATFVLMLEGGTNNVGPTTVTYVLGGSAMRGVDYTAAGISAADPPETIYSTIIGRNGTAASVVLTLTDDSTARESSETIILTVVGVANDAGLMSRPRALHSSATVTVADDEPSAAELIRLYMPVADAGDDRQYLETSSTVLDGSDSLPGASSDYSVLRYEWEQVNGAGAEADVITSGENHLGIITTRSEMPAVVVTLTDVVQATIYYFRLTVSVTTAGETYSSSDVVSVTSNDVEPPLADAGPDFAVTENVSVILSGHVSDPDDDAGLSLEWTQLENTPAVTFSAVASTNSEVSWTGVPAGSTAMVTLLLTVTDSQGLIATDTLSVTVRDDTPPVADAGDALSVNEGETVLLDGTGSRDSRGGAGTSQLSYLWQQVTSNTATAEAVANGLTLTTPQAAVTTWIAPSVGGDYHFRLTVTDSATRLASADVVTVTVTSFADRILSVSGPLSASEGGIVTYTVVLSGGNSHTQPITATWAFRVSEQSGDDDAEAADFGTGGDVEFPTDKVVFAVGMTRSEFSVLIYDDAVVEGREYYDVVISNLEDPSGRTVFSGSSDTLTLSGVEIAASDNLEVSVSAENTTVAEGATATFVLMLDGDPLTAAAAVPFRVTGDAADYDITEPPGLSRDATTGIVMIARGTTTGRIVLEISDDRETEGEETLTVELEASQTSASFRLGSASSASVTIAPSDRAPFILDAGYALLGSVVPPATVPDKTGGVASTSTILTLAALVASPSAGVTHTAVWRQVSGVGGVVIDSNHPDYAGAEISSEALGGFYSSGVSLKSVLTTTTYVFRFTVTATAIVGEFAGGDFTEMSSREVSVVVYDTDAPVAQAGEVPAPTVEGTTATLAGSGMDADGDTGLSYRWTQNPPSPEIVFASTTDPATVVTWPDVTTGSVMEFTLILTVTDSQGLFAMDTLSVTVRDDTPPVADAGDALSVNEGETVLLDGTGSRDSRGGASTSQLSYLWQQVTSNTATAEAVANGRTLTTPQAAVTTWIAPSVGGDYHFRLTVTDSATLLASADVVTVTVARLPDRILSVGGPSSASEGGIVTYTVVLSGGIPHTQPITATWAFQMSEQSGDDDAEAADFGTGGDVEFPEGKIVFAVGTTRSEFSVLIYDDVVAERQEHYDVVISNLEDPSGRTMFSGSTDTLILSGVEIAASDYLEVSVLAENDVVAEGATATFVLMLEGGTNSIGPTTVTYVLGGSAMRGVDYTAAGISEADPPETIYSTTIGRNGTAASVVLTLTDDSTARESSETIILTVAGVANDAGLMSRPHPLYSSATVTVADDEPSAAELVRLYMPVADAGDDRQYLETSSTVLDGSDSLPGASSDYSVLRYEWEQVNADDTGAAVITAGGENYLGMITTRSGMPAVGMVTLTDVVQATIYYFRLTVSVTTAGETYSSSDVVSVTINDVEPPLADAGLDFVVTENVSVILSGHVSDPDNDAGLSLEWTQLESTPAVTFSAAASTNSEVSWTGVPAGSTALVTLLLTARDSQGLIATDTLSVTVRDDTPPVADAGEDMGTKQEVDVTLDGTGSRDSRGGANTSQLSYLWQQVASNDVMAEVVTNGVVLKTPDEAITEWAASENGDYYFRLTVTDRITRLASADVVWVAVTEDGLLPRRSLRVRIRVFLEGAVIP